jgi:hypothetical protein
LLTVPVEWLVIIARLVDAAVLPVDRPWAAVVSMILACRGAGMVAPLTGIRIGRSHAEQSGDADSCCQCRHGQGTLQSHYVTPFLVYAVVLPHEERR